MQRRSTSILARLVPAVVAVLLVVSVLPTSSAHASGARRYARPLGQPVGACDTWANACELYYALQVSAANSGGEVWARGGTYTPNPSSASNSLVVGEGVLLYGGFTGEETALSQRKPSVNITTLSGDLNLDGTWTGNSVHVVTLTGVSSATLVDGFAIVQGYANDTYGAWGFVTRDQMAAFVSRALYLPLSPYRAVFDDVPETFWDAAEIEERAGRARRSSQIR